MNSLKTFMNKVGEKVRDVTPQGPASIIDATDPQNAEFEGFVCPSCFERFSTPETLEKHYSDVHLDPSANYLCPVCKARLNSQSELEMHYAANHDNKDFTDHSIEALKEELIETSTNLREERWYSEELKKEVTRLQDAFKKKNDDDTDSDSYVHKTQLEAVEESKSLLSSEVILLRKQLSESLSQCSLLRSEKDSVELRATNYAVEKAELRATLDTFQTEKACVEQQLEDFISKSTAMESRNNDKVEKITSEAKRLETLLDVKGKEMQIHKDREIALQQDLKVKSEITSEIKEEMRNIKMDFDLMKIKLQEKSDQIMDFHAKEADAKQLSESLSLMKLNQPNNIEMPTSDNTEYPEPCVDDNEKYKQECDSFKKELRNNKTQIELLNSRVDDAERSQVHAENLAREKLRLIDDLEDSKYELQKTLENLKNKMSDIQQNLLDRDQTIDMLNTKIVELFELRKRIESDCEIIQNLRCEIEKEKQISCELCVTVADNSDEINDLKDLKHKLNVELDDTKMKDISLHATNEYQLKEIEAYEEANSERTIEIERLTASLVTFSANEESLKQKLNSNYTDIKQLNALVESLKVEKRNLENEVEIVSSKHIKIENELLSEIKIKKLIQDKVTNAQNELDRQTLKLEQSLTEYKNLLLISQDKITDMTSERDQLANGFKELDTVRCELESDKNILVDELASLNSKLLESSAVNSTMSVKLANNEIKIVDINLKNKQYIKETLFQKEKFTLLEQDLFAQKLKMSEIEGNLSMHEADLARLAGDKLELEVKIEASMEERQSMLERCVAAESEVERLQHQLTQLRRKMVDSTAALHELGRENQSLQMENAKLAGRIWTEDSDVTKCTHCDKSFTMTLRKHHCRKCYQIFCNDCSSKSISIELNKKPVRVCDSCHNEIFVKT